MTYHYILSTRCTEVRSERLELKNTLTPACSEGRCTNALTSANLSFAKHPVLGRRMYTSSTTVERVILALLIGLKKIHSQRNCVPNNQVCMANTARRQMPRPPNTQLDLPVKAYTRIRITAGQVSLRQIKHGSKSATIPCADICYDVLDKALNVILSTRRCGALRTNGTMSA
jgi:hypothetical protein